MMYRYCGKDSLTYAESGDYFVSNNGNEGIKSRIIQSNTNEIEQHTNFRG